MDWLQPLKPMESTAHPSLVHPVTMQSNTQKIPFQGSEIEWEIH
jgi:hypothetical protein